MNKLFSIVVFLLLLSTLCWAKEKKDKDVKPSPQSQQQAKPQPKPATPASPYFTGTGGKGMSIAILAPRTTGFAANQSYLPALVQGEFVSNFSGFSAISVLDRQRLEDQYAELLSGYYDDNAQAGLDLGHLTPTTHIMGGNITKTATGYALQIQITKTADKMTAASYSGTCTFAELDNLTGIRRASLELLEKMGVTPTERTRTELAGAAIDNHINAQTALAKGITAQKQGTEVAALSYYYQAAALDTSLIEAASRASVMSADITSGNIGNIGDNVRNDIQWRKDWVARLTECERYFDNFFKTSSLPYTLFYSTEITQGKIDYNTETAILSIDVNLHPSGIWIASVEMALETVYKGLDATKRKNDWGLAAWPGTGVTNLKPFITGNKTFAVSAELINDRKQVIGKQNFTVKGSWAWKNTTIDISPDDAQTVSFSNVKAANITDKLTIRIASVNGVDAQSAAQNGVLQIRAVSGDEFNLWRMIIFSRGVITGVQENAHGKIATIPETLWGDPVIGIGAEAFRDNKLTSVTIPNSVTSIGAEAFSGNKLTSVTIPNSVTSIGARAFYKNNLTSVTIPNGITSIGHYAFANNQLTSVTIPNSVTSIEAGAFSGNKLTSVTIPNSVISIEYAAFGDNNLTSVTIPNSVTSLSGFSNNWLTSVTIPNSVTSIGEGAFNKNQLTSVTIPNSVTYIGAEAFYVQRQYNVSDIYKMGPSDKTLTSVTIGAGVTMSRNSFQDQFSQFYEKNGKKAGVYKYNSSPLSMGWYGPK